MQACCFVAQTLPMQTWLHHTAWQHAELVRLLFGGKAMLIYHTAALLNQGDPHTAQTAGSSRSD